MPALPTEYTISPSKDSTLAVEVFHTGFLARRKKRVFFFESFRGDMRLVEDNPLASEIRLIIDARSVVCRDAGLSDKERLATAEFVREEALQARLYPDIRYTSTRVSAKPLRGFVVTGALQIRETTRELNVNMAWSPRRTDEFQLDGDAMVRLSDFGLPRPSKLFGQIRTMNEAMLHLLLWAIPAARLR